LFNALPRQPSLQKLEIQRTSRGGVEGTKVDFDKAKIAARLDISPPG
jgi:hypothetical protein